MTNDLLSPQHSKYCKLYTDRRSTDYFFVNGTIENYGQFLSEISGCSNTQNLPPPSYGLA